MAEHQQQQTIEAVLRILHQCESILFITGAGISADSGLPTYRGIGGLYEVEDTEEGIPIEVILSGPMLRKNPELTWKYPAQIADGARGASFNRAHQVIAEMEQHFSRVWTLTQRGWFSPFGRCTERYRDPRQHAVVVLHDVLLSNEH